MSSITSVSMGRQMMDSRITQATKAGALSSTDQTALESALNSIDKSLASSSSGTTSGTDVKAKMDGLIQDQVSAGTLTSDQAKELQAFFAQGPGGAPPSAGGSDAQSMSVDGVQSTGATTSSDGTHAMQGPPPPPPPSGDATSSTSSSSSDSSSSKLDVLKKFLASLQASTSSNTYGSTGSSTSGLVVDATA